MGQGPGAGSATPALARKEYRPGHPPRGLTNAFPPTILAKVSLAIGWLVGCLLLVPRATSLKLMKLTRPTQSFPLRERVATGAVGVIGMTVSAFIVGTAVIERDFRMAGLFACVFGIGLIALLLAVRSPDAPVPRLLDGLEDGADSD